MKINIRNRSVDLYHLLPLLILIVIFAFLPVFVKTRFWLNIFVIVFYNCIAASSLRTIMLSGNPSFATGAFLGTGAYMAAVL